MIGIVVKFDRADTDSWNPLDESVVVMAGSTESGAVSPRPDQDLATSSAGTLNWPACAAPAAMRKPAAAGAVLKI